MYIHLNHSVATGTSPGVARHGRRVLSISPSQYFSPVTNMAANMAAGCVEHWGEIDLPLLKTPALHIEITEPKPAEYEVPRLHQPSSEHFPPKDE